MLVSGAAQAATRTRAQALSLVKEKYASRDVDIYYLEDDPASPGLWRFFVDANPMAGWEHECYVVTLPKTVPSSGTGLAQTEMRMPPAETRTPAEVKNRWENVSWTQPSLPNAFTGNSPFSEAGERTYAVILNGGLDASYNREQYWHNCSFMYQILTRTIGVPKNQIYVIMSDGTSNGQDMTDHSGKGVDSSKDLDGDNLPDIQYAATRENVQGVLSEIADKIEAGDHLLFYITGHGGHDQNKPDDCYTFLWSPAYYPPAGLGLRQPDYAKMYDYELANWLAPVLAKDAAVSVMLTHCYSGGFKNDLTSAGCVVMTAAKNNQESHYAPDVPYDEFAYHWMSAINGATPYGEKVNADLNGDGYVSMKEAFNYASLHDRYNVTSLGKPETPDSQSIPSHLMDGLGLANPLYPAELYISTAANDNGIYSPSYSSRFWTSPSLWLRNAQDGGAVCDIPYYSSTHKQAYVYTRIGNRGWRPYKGGKFLHLYWHEGSTCVTPNGWRGLEKENGVATGGKIGLAYIPGTIQPGSSVVQSAAWTLPSNVFSSSAGQTVSLLANIRDTSSDNIASDQLFYTFNAAKNPKTAQRTTTSLAAPTGNVSVRRNLRFTNLMSDVVYFDLDLRPHTDADKALFADQRLELIISSDLYWLWFDGGAEFNRTLVTRTVSGDYSIMMLDHNSSIRNIPALGKSFEKIGIRLQNYTNRTVTGGPYHVDLVQTKSGGSVYGGIDLVAMNTTSGSSSVSLKETTADGAILSVDLPESERVLGWYDSESQLVGCGEEATVRSFKDNSRFTVITASDGENAAYSCMDVAVPGTIKDLVRKDAGRFEVVLSDKAPRTLHIQVLSGLTAQTVCLSEIREGADCGTVDLSDVPGGTYILVVMDGEVMTDTWKFNK